MLSPGIVALSAMFTHPLHLEVMVTLACPYCPKMVHLAYQLALANPLIHADMVDAAEFPQLISRYDIHGTPLTIINDRRGFEGALAAEEAILEILRAAEPDSYERVEARLRVAQGLRKVEEVRSDVLYDIVVVGAGPAGIAAAMSLTSRINKSWLLQVLAPRRHWRRIAISRHEADEYDAQALGPKRFHNRSERGQALFITTASGLIETSR